jgi:hypothetical protein
MNPPSEQIRKELGPDESVLWSGQPRQGLCFCGVNILSVPFSILWCGFAIFWEYSVLNANAPFFFGIFGIPFVVLGLYLVFGRFFVDIRQRANTHYAVTSQRIIIVSGLFSRNVESLDLRSLSELSLSEGSSRYGSISFSGGYPFSFMFRYFSGWPGMSRLSGPHFFQIQGAQGVYEMIRGAQQRSR